MKILIKNASIVTPYRLIRNGYLSVEDGKIAFFNGGEPSDLTGYQRKLTQEGGIFRRGSLICTHMARGARIFWTVQWKRYALHAVHICGTERHP